MSDEMKKSGYGISRADYDPHVNQERKANNTGDRVPGNGKNVNVKSFSSRPGQLSAKQEAARMHTKKNIIENSGPVKILSPEEIAEPKLTPPSKMKKDEDMLEVEADGKQELVEGKEPLKKDPVTARWSKLKKALDHNKAFMSMEEELESPEQDEEQEQEQPQQQEEMPEGGEEQQEPDGMQDDGEQEQPADDADSDQEQLEAVSDSDEGEQDEPTNDNDGNQEPLEAVSAGEEGDAEEQPGGEEESQEQPEDQEEGNGSLGPDQQELMDALREEGYSDQEIAYIVHGHHTPEMDATQHAKAAATKAMSQVDVDNASQMAEIEREHAKRSMDHDHQHKQRMSDVEYEAAQKKSSLTDIDAQHRQRMLELEYTNAQKAKEMEMQMMMQQKQMEMQQAQAAAPDAEADKAAQREMQQVEIQKKKLELKIREEEMKLELEFKKKEHELRLKLMEAQIKEQAKQKSEISGIKHKQRLEQAKNPPAKSDGGEKKPAKKALKKSEEQDE